MPKSTSPDSSLFIGGIYPDVTYKELSAAVTTVAPFKSLKVIRNNKTGLCKGFAFLTVSDPSSARRLLSTPLRLRDRLLQAQSRGSDMAKTERDARRVFVGGLPLDTTDCRLLEVFQGHFKAVRSAYIIREHASGKSRGYGYVEFGRAEDAQLAVRVGNYTMGQEVVLEVQPFLGKNRRTRPKVAPHPRPSKPVLVSQPQARPKLSPRGRKHTQSQHMVESKISSSVLAKVVRRSQKLDTRIKNYRVRQSFRNPSSRLKTVFSGKPYL